MHLRNRSQLACAVALAASALVPATAGAYNTYTITFQQGVNGYTGEVDRMFRSSDPTRAGGAGPNASGLIAADGYDDDPVSPDQQVFLRFNNIIGSGAGQIPTGAFVLDASLTLTTGPSGSDNSGGPYGVGAVLVNWNTTTSTYNSLKSAGSPANGLSAQYGGISRAVGFYDNPAALYGGNNALDFNEVATANVAPLVRNWVNNPSTNYGFTVHAGVPSATNDAWQFGAGNHPTPANRPLLSVTYTDAPVTTASFQQGVNGYTGTTMSWMRLETNSGTDGSTINSAFLDGWQFNGDQDNISSDDHALIKFDKIFQAQGGSIPAHAQIVKATLVLTTSEAGNAQTGQPYQAHQLLRPWGADTAWTDFDAFYGPRIGVDETPMLSAQYGMIPDSQAQFDITSAVASWAAGQPNYGIDVRATPPTNQWGTSDGTNDGWSIYFTGATDPTLRPQLLVSYFLHKPGDANDNGKIDADDFVLIDRGYRRQFASPQWADGDFNYDGLVDAADYLIIDSAWAAQGGHPLDPSFLAAREAQFGADYAAALVAAVPEPSSLAACGLAALPLLRRRRV